MMAATSIPRLFDVWRVEAFIFFAAFHVGGPCCLYLFSADVFHCMTKCLIIGNRSNTVQRSIRHPDLLLPDLLWLGKCQSTLTQAQHSSELVLVCYRGLYLSLDLFARGTSAPRVAVGSTRRTCSTWSFTIARRRKLGSLWRRSSSPVVITLAT